eukprot:7885487-Pyramimonas_sp.AAC.3
MRAARFSGWLQEKADQGEEGEQKDQGPLGCLWASLGISLGRLLETPMAFCGFVGGPRGLFERLGCLWGAFWGLRLGATWGPFESISWAPLNLCGPLGRLLVPSWSPSEGL